MLLILNVLFWLGGSAVAQDIKTGLFITPLIEDGLTEEARNYSKVEPTFFAGVESHSAFITVNKTSLAHLFFWFFPAQGLPLNSTPWIIWLQGGPGGSSLFGLFEEIGPLQIVNDTVTRMPITWGSDYSLLFIDNPVGAGFSFSETGELVENEDQVGAALLNFLQQFLEVFPELRQAPLFLTGESYAGKYLPAFGHYIHTHKNASRPINLKGLAIGDGWIDPISMLRYSEYGLQIGVLDPEQANIVRNYEDQAREYYKNGNMTYFRQTAEAALNSFLNFSQVDAYNFLVDMRPPIGEAIENLFKNMTIRNKIHAGDQNYDIMNGEVYAKLYKDMYMTMKPRLEGLLEHYGVLCYNGQLDVIVAYALSVNTYRSLEWSGADSYRNATREIVYSEDRSRINSYMKRYGNLWDVMVRGAGHMVPSEQPAAAKQMIDMFINQFKQ